jgi:hypothetical protein
MEKLHNKPSSFVLLAKYYSNDQIKEDETGRVCSKHGSAYNVSVGKPEGKRPLGKPKHTTLMM